MLITEKDMYKIEFSSPNDSKLVVTSPVDELINGVDPNSPEFFQSEASSINNKIYGLQSQIDSISKDIKDENKQFISSFKWPALLIALGFTVFIVGILVYPPHVRESMVYFDTRESKVYFEKFFVTSLGAFTLAIILMASKFFSVIEYLLQRKELNKSLSEANKKSKELKTYLQELGTVGSQVRGKFTQERMEKIRSSILENFNGRQSKIIAEYNRIDSRVSLHKENTLRISSSMNALFERIESARRRNAYVAFWDGIYEAYSMVRVWGEAVDDCSKCAVEMRKLMTSNSDIVNISGLDLSNLEAQIPQIESIAQRLNVELMSIESDMNFLMIGEQYKNRIDFNKSIGALGDRIDASMTSAARMIGGAIYHMTGKLQDSLLDLKLSGEKSAEKIVSSVRGSGGASVTVNVYR